MGDPSSVKGIMPAQLPTWSPSKTCLMAGMALKA
eukprot:CAMPEP_0182506196 /NCGR_PEP_ID=MMETSP1321-20130603/20741_1 /TAXON_ID=91990 /ORGANISM="Bolidomonas sp., Strain RCC1657" /LENGTH=33 /DNA_ID= /DNA_START= /DNA_END= /DNA_ORIENTATION=